MKGIGNIKVFAAAVVLLFCIAANARELNVLTIGNSFADSVFVYLPKIAAAEGRELVIDRANHGGCELDRHWSYVVREEKNPELKLYKNNKCSLREILQSRKWDIVSIQQASHKSWIAESYFPYAQYLKDYIKKNAPQAEVVIQQTWAYNPDDSRLNDGAWKITQSQMFDKIRAAYADAARRLGGLRIIPTGLAIDIARKNEPHPYKGNLKQVRDTIVPPDLPTRAGEFVGNFGWTKNKKTGELELYVDTIHLNNRGEYLQACVWYGFLFDKDPETIKYVPDSIGDSDAKRIRKAASEALKSIK